MARLFFKILLQLLKTNRLKDSGLLENVKFGLSISLFFCEERNLDHSVRFCEEMQEIIELIIEDCSAKNSAEIWHRVFPDIVKEISKLRLNLRARKDKIFLWTFRDSEF